MELLLEEDLLLIEGGKNWLYIIGGTITAVAGVAGTVLGPELGSKGLGVAGVIGGVTTVIEGWNAD
ncbi:hypothetical protein ABGF49_06180 [Helcococcus ovis]|uniref:Uncharacterized protein n=1 Tax=Helcococcus ovis TaxID=72026 RepID=A0A4R9C0R5_9FIRM|nr:hypothetical protein [Helcococcus ovis]TFF63973.1 hypothetical protein EQF92_07710 [Helcococcus ovis]TFF64547.1 hypothetical protein EQF91_07570 [Helcococcus ovis]TFF65830.1 hypothetical protein EQF93_07885 [Helcococcus ovis]WNZ00741.1 hypothetical protein EQF90_005630 [Helcococcus ovis]